MDIAIVLYDGFDDLDAIGPFEVFGHASKYGANLDVGLYTLDEQDVVVSSHGLRIEPDGTLADWIDDTKAETGDTVVGESGDTSSHGRDVVVVPGGGWSTREFDSAWGEAERGDLPDALADLHERGVTVASVCTGGMLLARAGLTDGRPAITHHSALEDLRDSGARVVDARVVDDGDVVTAGGITAGIDLALHLVEREIGEDVAERVAATMEYERRAGAFEPD